MFDNDTQLMVSIFRRVFQLVGSEERVPERYVKSYKLDIEEAGQLFACLGLAKPDTQSPLGWRPTLALMEIIANRAVRSAKPIERMVSAEDRLIFRCCVMPHLAKPALITLSVLSRCCVRLD